MSRSGLVWMVTGHVVNIIQHLVLHLHSTSSHRLSWSDEVARGVLCTLANSQIEMKCGYCCCCGETASKAQGYHGILLFLPLFRCVYLSDEIVGFIYVIGINFL